MAQIGSIYLGGREGKPDTQEIFQSGIAFSLKEDSKVNELFLYNTVWEAEVKQGHKYIIARSRDTFTVDQILAIGFEACQHFLDLLSVERNADIKMTVGSCEVKQDKYGNIIPEQPKKIPPRWRPAFRYYRLSQTNNDLYEAYKNLYLGLESLLNIICQKGKHEHERDWLLRALNEVNNKTSLSKLVPPNTTDPVDYLVKTQYDEIRLKLFHAKNQNILPHENLNPTKVSDAYTTLLRLWQQIITNIFNVNVSSGVITYQGFKAMMDNVFGQGFFFYATSDPSVPTKEDVDVSPLNCPIYSFVDNKCEGEKSPGHILLSGVIYDELKKIDSIHRICLKIDETLYSVAFIKDGLLPIGVDKFENNEILRLINKNAPKTIF